MRTHSGCLVLILGSVLSFFFPSHVQAQSGSATFVRTDTTTQGNWHGAYGADGYSLAGDTASIPSYSTVAVQNQAEWTWTEETTDIRGLQTGNGVGRIAAAWYNSPSFSFDVNFTDGQSHQLALYAVDWDNLGRAETIQVLDAGSQTVLNTQSISSFSNGTYLVWSISGHVTVNVIGTGGPNAAVSGVFFGGSSTITSAASYVRSDSSTQGNWHAAYGADGYSVANDSQSVPSYATFAIQNQAGWTYSSESTDVRALQTGNGVGRIAATWYNSPSFSFDVNIADGNSHQFALYAIDWDNLGRAETIQVLDAATEAVLNTQNISGFTNGVYLVWNVSGHVKINVIATGGPNGAVSGVFFGGSTPINSATNFVRSDTTTQGNWHGMYGADGYSVANDSQSIPSYATFTIQNQAAWTYSPESTDVRALQTGSGVGRIAAAWYNSPSFSFDVNFTDGKSHQFALYAIDWDPLGRAEAVQVLDAATDAILDTRSISAFTNGVYLVWNLSGHVKINVIGTAGPNAVISGVFFGGSAAITSAASFLRSDNTTQGNWHGAYGADGYSVASDSQSIPSYATFAIQNQATWTYSPESTDARALQTGSGVGRIAATWYNSPSISFDVNFTDGNSHQFALYGIDWDSLGRAETVQVRDAGTEAVLDTENLSGFTAGTYLVWNISGHVKINVIGTGGPNAVISGVFFGGSSPVTSTVSFVRSDTTTQGTWHGSYGADGYSVSGDAQSVPAYATFSIQNQAGWTWDSNSSDPRALQMASGSGRIAATWYNSPSFSFDVNFTDGNSHQFALYAIDWDNLGRAESIQVLDGATEAVLSTQNIAAFSNGVYLVWNISGHVKINVIGTEGPNAVVSGVFWDPTASSGGTTPVLQSISIAPSNPSITLGAVQQLAATGTYSDGTTQVLSASVTWSSAAPQVATINSFGLVSALIQGTTAITAGLGGISASTTVTVTSSVPNIVSVSPTSGAAGTQVSITGSGFGSVQGSGTVQLGSRSGIVMSWSDTAVVATVATGSVSGTAQVRPSGTPSNSVPFMVITATIASISPTSAAAGTQVTITGSGFGTAQGAGQVWLGTAPAQVSSWSDGQVVATVATGSNSGNAQILQNGVWSNSVAFTVAGGPPHIISINPNTGSGGTVVTIQGTGFGSSQGIGIAWIGATSASVNSWSDTQVSATVGTNAVSGVAKVQQNGLWSNAVTFTIPSANSVTLNPNVANMLVGDTRSITALNTTGQPVAGLTWTSSDPTVATLSTADPPVITAVAPGNVTITAGGASADVTVYAGTALPLGTVLWSDPGDGSGVECCTLNPAVPSPTGVADVFALQVDGSVEAITSDGAVAWSTNLPTSGNFLVPDFQGGTIVANTGSIYRLDGITGQPYPAYSATTYAAKLYGLGVPAVHTDGTIFTIDYACSAINCPGSSDSTDGAWVVGIDPSTGTAKFKVPAVNSTIRGTIADSWCYQTPGQYNQSLNPLPYNIIIAGDGFAYTSYTTSDSTYYEKQPAVLRWPAAAYQDFNQLQDDTITSNFTAAFADYNALLNLTGGTGGLAYNNDLYQTLQNNVVSNLSSALKDEYGLSQLFTRVCDISESNLLILHILRVGPDGSSSDVVVQQWSESDSVVNNGIHSAGVQSGPNVSIDGPGLYMITDADTGALISWQLTANSFCAATTDGVCSGHVDGTTEYHLTTTAGGAVAANVIMNQAVAGQHAPIAPLLQLADGSYVGSNFPAGGTVMVGFDASGNVRWTVPNDSPQMATADGGIIGSSGVTYDANGAATGQLANLPQFPSWLGNGYAYGSVELVAFALPDLAATFAALQGGNASANGTAIQQVQTNQPQGLAKQLPSLLQPVSCLQMPGTVIIPVCGNVNAIELLTNQSTDAIFKQYVQTFAPAADTTQSPNSIMFFDDPQNPGAPINVTRPGQVLQITLRGFIIGHLQKPFSVQTERVDVTNHVISVVTLQGHPLAGWRYWRVYSIGTTPDGKNDVVIETGAYDEPGPGPKNYAGYFKSRGDVADSWAEYLRFIQRALNAPQGSNLHNTLGGTQIINYFPGQWEPPTLVDGYWDYAGYLTNYILNNVCQSTTCN